VFDHDTWTFINSFAPWLAAIGTIAAVVTSLHLARRADRLDLELSVGIWAIAVQGGGPEHGTEQFRVSVTNLGRRPATLTQLYWRTVPWRKAGCVWIAPVNSYSSEFPKTLSDGEAANYLIPIDHFLKSFGGYSQENFSGVLGWVRLRFLRFYVSTSTGATFSCKPESPIAVLIRKIAGPQDTVA
jgi:hypothetical protein